MTGRELFDQKNGDVTKAAYAEMNKRGPVAQLAVALFRAQKRSTAAKTYRGRGARDEAYAVKNWSLEEICRILTTNAASFRAFAWGWQTDESVMFASDPSEVLYVELPGYGQVSFHSRQRLSPKVYDGKWDGEKLSEERILAFWDANAR